MLDLPDASPQRKSQANNSAPTAIPLTSPETALSRLAPKPGSLHQSRTLLIPTSRFQKQRHQPSKHSQRNITVIMLRRQAAFHRSKKRATPKQNQALETVLDSSFKLEPCDAGSTLSRRASHQQFSVGPLCLLLHVIAEEMCCRHLGADRPEVLRRPGLLSLSRPPLFRDRFPNPKKQLIRSGVERGR